MPLSGPGTLKSEAMATDGRGLVLKIAIAFAHFAWPIKGSLCSTLAPDASPAPWAAFPVHNERRDAYRSIQTISSIIVALTPVEGTGKNRPNKIGIH